MFSIYYSKEVNAMYQGKQYSFSIETHNHDCKIGDFSHNVWFRSSYGIKSIDYKNNQSMETAIVKILKNRGFNNIVWITK